MQWRWQGLLYFAAVAISILLSAQAVAEDAKYRFDIEPTDLATALNQYADQAQLYIIFIPTNLLTQTRTKPLHGAFTQTEALDRILDGTPLKYRLERDGPLVSIIEPSIAKNAASPPAQQTTEANSPGCASRCQNFQEVVVTGSNLAVESIQDISAPLMRMDRDRLNAGSYQTVQDALRTSPLVSRAGPSETLSAKGGNFGRGSAINLRGLGPQATLVLVDGERQPFSGFYGDFVDVANLPTAVVEHIDVLADGASAIYGADAIAGVVNVMMRHDLEGTETRVRYGDGSGGADETVISQLWGHQWHRGKALFAYEFSHTNGLQAAARSYAADSDKRSIGGSDHSGIWSSPGNIVDPITLQPIYGITTTGDLVAGLVNKTNRFAQTELLPDRKIHKLYLTSSVALNDDCEAFQTLRYAHRATLQSFVPFDHYLYVPATNAYFPAALNAPSAIVAYRFINDLGPVVSKSDTDSGTFTAGIRGRLGYTWSGTLKGSSAIERLRVSDAGEPDFEKLSVALEDPSPITAFNPFSDGRHSDPETLRRIQSAYPLGATTRLDSIGLSANGDIGALRFGTAKLAIGLEHRREGIAQETTANRGFDRRVDSLYAEASVPLWSAASGDNRQVDLSVAARTERYSDASKTTNPRLGMRWVVSDSFRVRGSWGTSFRAPTLLDVHNTANNATFLVLLPDPKAVNGSSLVLAHQGANPDLRYETAETWSAGLDLFSKENSELTGSITFWDVRYRNRVLLPGPAVVSDILKYESQWSQVIERDPNRGEIAAACHSPDLVIPLDQCLASQPSAIIDLRLQNLAKTRMRGVDISAKGKLHAVHGLIDVRSEASYISEYSQAASSQSDPESLVATFGNPMRLRIRADMEWSEHGHGMPGWGMTLTLNHSPGYRDPGSSVHPRIVSLTTIDVGLRFREGAEEGWAVALNAVNLFKTNPPFADTLLGFDDSSADVYGRTVSLLVGRYW